eukprot:TRINITY_DN48959_c0_g1_i1.p1 TRINITY_DN48959_c0_g1~~TRINITY_DN48959_c0_g1_i1.p1  ORF type:complete len:507 (-),score=70.25 TRINITY_DN48959_c0_g1_i1:72-1592(-)
MSLQDCGKYVGAAAGTRTPATDLSCKGNGNGNGSCSVVAKLRQVESCQRGVDHLQVTVEKLASGCEHLEDSTRQLHRCSLQKHAISSVAASGHQLERGAGGERDTGFETHAFTQCDTPHATKTESISERHKVLMSMARQVIAASTCQGTVAAGGDILQLHNAGDVTIDFVSPELASQNALLSSLRTMLGAHHHTDVDSKRRSHKTPSPPSMPRTANDTATPIAASTSSPSRPCDPRLPASPSPQSQPMAIVTGTEETSARRTAPQAHQSRERVTVLSLDGPVARIDERLRFHEVQGNASALPRVFPEDRDDLPQGAFIGYHMTATSAAPVSHLLEPSVADDAVTFVAPCRESFSQPASALIPAACNIPTAPSFVPPGIGTDFSNSGISDVWARHHPSRNGSASSKLFSPTVLPPPPPYLTTPQTGGLVAGLNSRCGHGVDVAAVSSGGMFRPGQPLVSGEAGAGGSRVHVALSGCNDSGGRSAATPSFRPLPPPPTRGGAGLRTLG